MEPVITQKTNESGRPPIAEGQYQKWLDQMEHFLKLGQSISKAIENAGLQNHRTTLYEKLRLNDWFSDNLHYFESYMGEIVNEVLARQIFAIRDKIERNEELNRQDVKILKFVASNHRSASPFFIQKNERAKKIPSNPDASTIQTIVDQLSVM